MLFAVFDDAKAAEQGMSHLAQQGVPGEAIGYLDGPGGGGPREEANATAAGTVNTRTLAPGLGLRSFIDNFDIDESVRDYLKRLLSEGAILLTVDVDDEVRERAAQALSEAGATRVIGSEA